MNIETDSLRNITDHHSTGLLTLKQSVEAVANTSGEARNELAAAMVTQKQVPVCKLGFKLTWDGKEFNCIKDPTILNIVPGKACVANADGTIRCDQELYNTHDSLTQLS